MLENKEEIVTEALMWSNTWFLWRKGSFQIQVEY